ncbi:hypothetical protein VL15_04735 [Burkholderia cepacia]|uniref:Uncharacterized protein n=1 Tax=Burkholderia cepacia TaxID=292 RepID=A0A0J5X3Z0_BURCE|nr:hypothetical protein VL15_04735 [Burkholderia cepacia]
MALWGEDFHAVGEMFDMKSVWESKATNLRAEPIAECGHLPQEEQPAKTRAEVRKELIQIEKAGYKPSMARSTQYPENLQAAQARAAAMNNPNTGNGPAQ